MYILKAVAIFFFIDEPDKLIAMFWDGLDCFAPSNNEAGDFFTWYE